MEVLKGNSLKEENNEGGLESLNMGNRLDYTRFSLQAIELFKGISGVARVSGYTEKIVNFLKDFADSHNLQSKIRHTSYTTDPDLTVDDGDIEKERKDYTPRDGDQPQKNKESIDAYNIWIDIEPTKGCEHFPKVILQAHTDMVDAGDPAKHDFKKDPIEIDESEEGVLKAKGTTLGADDGIGMALMLAVTTSDIPHGPVRLLFTADEETSFAGAEMVTAEDLEGECLINLDSEDVDEICYSSAGSLNAVISQTFDRYPLSPDDTICKLSLSGLKGGHSGVDIDNEDLMHGNRTIFEIVREMQDQGIPVRLCRMGLGSRKNAIPNAGVAFVAIPSFRVDEAKAIFDEIMAQKKVQFDKEVDMKASFSQESVDDVIAISEGDSKKIVDLYFELPHGVKNRVNDELVETSAYAGRISLKEGKLRMESCARSCMCQEILDYDELYRCIKDKYGFQYTGKPSVPWESDPESSLVKLTERAYENLENKITPKVKSIHAGLECSCFLNIKPDLLMISLGPTIKGVHSVHEKLYLSTVKDCAEVLGYILAHADELKKDN